LAARKLLGDIYDLYAPWVSHQMLHAAGVLNSQQPDLFVAPIYCTQAP
jgi:hypothetical protein